jgi:hypothetical protein
MCVAGMMRLFSRSFASWPVESAYADERSVHDVPQLSCDGRLLVVSWSSPLKGSLQYDKQTACCLLTIAQFGKYDVADHRALVPARRVSQKTGT